jgi:hypothetical protein
VGAYAAPDAVPRSKLILKPDHFTSVESFRDFGKLLFNKAAKKQEVDFIPDEEAGLRPNIREILSLDTPDFRLYRINESHKACVARPFPVAGVLGAF